MKIAIPSETDAGLESIRSGHFGHAAYMTVVEFDDDMNIVGVESATPFRSWRRARCPR